MVAARRRDIHVTVEHRHLHPLATQPSTQGEAPDPTTDNDYTHTAQAPHPPAVTSSVTTMPVVVDIEWPLPGRNLSDR
ncbi:hypothetical protein GCM10022224_045240 [Nonomuraea antimicrobica]|uniref:Uncharacterized protein n=1 Tax=Nonomuraea antimicrobica TaxID=561173 RepID=A0ABP7C0S9_9ACTN